MPPAEIADKVEVLPAGVRHIAIDFLNKENEPKYSTHPGWVDAGALSRRLISQLREGETLCADTRTLRDPKSKWVDRERIMADGVEYLVVSGGETMVGALCIYQNREEYGQFDGFYAVKKQPPLL